MSEKALLMVEGMDCANCASTIERTLSKEGFKDVSVDFITGEVSFNPPVDSDLSSAVNSIHRLGYKVSSNLNEVNHSHDHHDHLNHPSDKQELKFFISLVFTVPLILHMF